MMPDILFFRSSASARTGAPPAGIEAGGATLEVWRPRLLHPHPPGLRWLPYAVWWGFHYAGVFRNDQYRMFLLREQGRIVHRSCVFPPFFRFPFMAREDVQVGDVWTAEDRRGRGLSAATLRHIIASYPDRRIWFLCERSNVASARLAASAGMQLAGVGCRRPRLGLGVLGQFVLTQAEPAK
jgi:GNAT superfamily N-acetyltransferase